MFLVSWPSGFLTHLLLLTGQVSVLRTSTQFFKYTCRVTDAGTWHIPFPLATEFYPGSLVGAQQYDFPGGNVMCTLPFITSGPQMQALRGQEMSSSQLVSLANKILVAVDEQLAAPTCGTTIYRACKVVSPPDEILLSVVVV